MQSLKTARQSWAELRGNFDIREASVELSFRTRKTTSIPPEEPWQMGDLELF